MNLHTHSIIGLPGVSFVSSVCLFVCCIKDLLDTLHQRSAENDSR